MVSVISPEEPDEILDTLHTVDVRVVGDPVVDPKARTSCLHEGYDRADSFLMFTCNSVTAH